MRPRLFVLDLVHDGPHVASVFRLSELIETIAGSLQDSQALLKMTAPTKESAKIQTHVADSFQSSHLEIDVIGNS
jgi:hypothetical protein